VPTGLQQKIRVCMTETDQEDAVYVLEVS